MHPAASLIAFTSLSGLGFGLMIFLGIHVPVKGPVATTAFALLALGLSSVGLLSSLLHLGHPERAWRALSQWRSSWLSREGVLSVCALSVFFVYMALIVFAGTHVALLGWLSSILATLTVLSTAMIYAQLRTVPRWHTPLTPVLFLAWALAGGALIVGQMMLAGWLLIALGAVQIAYWLQGDGAFANSGTTMESATGLGHLGKVRLFESPHTGGNYLLREMAFRVGRKHVAKLRALALGFGIVLPALLAFFTAPHHLLGAAMVISHILGLLAARWLFYAQAEHVVSLYYGMEAAS